MKLPISWLREFVAVDATPETLAERLTFSGTEVEGIRRIGEGCEGIVVGEVLEVGPHPNADRLRVCRVSDGSETVPIVCGAPNVRAGMKAPLARVGCRLPDGTVLREAKLRGEVSRGMLCAEDELGLSDDHGGIMELPAEAVTGSAFLDAIGGVETVLDLEVTWNRPDCLSILGMAREVAALFDLPLTLPPVEVAESGAAVETFSQVRIEAPEACPRYTARVLTMGKHGPSPLWMRRRLACCGVRAIGRIVDVTNYVMLETGQPLHAFDHRLLRDGRIVVRLARPGETLVTLDESERPLAESMLVIADAERPVAVAGIMGGAGSEITDETDVVLLESACFDPARTHATSVALGLATESSHRFERGVDLSQVEWAGRRAARLMAELTGAAVAPGVLDVFPAPPAPRRITCRLPRLQALLGIPIEATEGRRLLERLAIPVCAADAESLTVEAPAFRHDLTIEADIIEEIARLHGLEAIPETPATARLVPGADDSRTRSAARCRNLLTGLGLTEIANYSFVSAALLNRFGGEAERVVLPNPVSIDHACLRDSLLPQLVETLGRNLAHQVPDVACFELGRVYRRGADGTVTETERLVIGLMGRVEGMDVSGQGAPPPETVFLRLKGIVEALSEGLHAEDLRFETSRHDALQPGTCLAVRRGEASLGSVGLLARAVGHPWRLPEGVAVAELDLAPLLTRSLAYPRVNPPAVYPKISRDLAVIVPESARHADVRRTIEASAPGELTSIRLFDIFKGKEIGEGRKSMAYALTYQSAERTLTDDEVNAAHERIMGALRKGLSAEIREG